MAFSNSNIVARATSKVTNMRPAKHSGKTSSLELIDFRLMFVSVDERFFFVFNRFHNMTKMLCSPLIQR